MINRRTLLRSTGVTLGIAAVGSPATAAERTAAGTGTTDYIVVGSGPAGTVLASRLSEDRRVSVMLLEAGGENTNEVSRIQGAFFRVWGTDYDWAYSTTSQPELGGRTIAQPRGRVIGGSAAINVGAWLRGVPADYDSMHRAGATRLSGAGAIQTFKRLEDTTRAAAGPLRGSGGPMRLAPLDRATPLSDRLADAFVEAGFGPRGDVAAESPYVVDRFETTFPEHRRRTPADALLSSDVRRRPNLTVLTGARATRILFHGRRADGIRYTRNGQSVQLRARRGVILAAGAYNTPQLLMLSGSGPAQHLRSFGIDVVADVPGVGANLQDHLGVRLRGLGRRGTTGSIPMAAKDEWIEQWLRDRSGPANYFQENNVGFFRTDRRSPWPDFEALLSYNPHFGNGAYFTDVPDKDDRAGYYILVVQLHPRSRGSLQLASPDPAVAPVINPGYLSDPRDIDQFVTGLRRAHRLLATKTLEPYSEFVHPAANASDDVYRDLIRADAGTMYHPVGTARMGHFSDPRVVVDPDFQVRDVAGLYVADASVFPHLVSGHTMAPTMYLGEVAAAAIRSRSV